MNETWTAVDRYLTDLFVPPDAALDAAIEASAAAGLPDIQVSPNQGKLLHLLARSHGARTSWNSARWADIARSGSPGHCRRAGGSSRWNTSRNMPRSPGQISRGPASPTWSKSASAPPWRRCRNWPPKAAGRST